MARMASHDGATLSNPITQWPYTPDVGKNSSLSAWLLPSPTYFIGLENPITRDMHPPMQSCELAILTLILPSASSPLTSSSAAYSSALISGRSLCSMIQLPFIAVHPLAQPLPNHSVQNLAARCPRCRTARSPSARHPRCRHNWQTCRDSSCALSQTAH